MFPSLRSTFLQIPMTTSRKPLPAAFTSLYRLALRASAASVLYHKINARYLRALFRPTFQEAALVIRRLEDGPSDQARLSKWLEIWQTRIDGTLSLLANSAASRGVPHNLTRNLASTMHLSPPQPPKKGGRWNPALPATSKAYEPKFLSTFAKADELQAYNDEVFGALGEVIMMAEGRHRILLGRVLHKGTSVRDS